MIQNLTDPDLERLIGLCEAGERLPADLNAVVAATAQHEQHKRFEAAGGSVPEWFRPDGRLRGADDGG